MARELPEPVVSIGTNADSAFVIATRTGEVAVWEPGSKGVRLARDAPAPLAVEEYVDGLGKWLCAEHYRPLQGGSLAGEMGRDEFATLLLDVLRQTTRAEVGVINREAIRDPGLFPLRGIATRFDVLAALPFEDVLAETRCRGSVLKAFALAPRFKEYEARGLTASDGVVKINGRPVEADQWYQVVTTGFVASLEKDGLGGGVAFERRPGSSPRDLLLAWLEQATPSGQVAQPEDPASLARWHLRISLDGALSDARIGNPDPATYNDAQLTRIEASNVALDARFYAGADHPALTFQNTLRVEYGLGRTVTEGRDSGFVETRDLVSARSGLAWRLFRSERRWYHPLPDVEGFTETEFNRPQDGTRSYHHLLLRPTLGSRFDLTARLYLRFGVGLESELFAENPLKSVGLARVELNPGELLTLGNRSIEGRFFLETAFVDPWRQLDLQVRASVQVAVPLWRFLSITAGYDTFLRALGGKRLALAGDLALGLKFAVDHSIQSF
ncbi:MAG: hypothetical protein HY901_25900 [Deltaproteobacteria bacterium]|nr:hypothetical protein [Deltaproteobacteria bacterium]